MFLDRRLVECGVWRNYPRTLVPADHVIIEMPQFYRASQSKGDPNDLAKVAVGVGKYLARYEDMGATTATVLPADWKGQVPKGVHHPRILAKLTPEEQAVVHAAGLKWGKAVHNTMDAVGLGQWAWASGKWTS